ncbi:acetyl-CoA synthetase-like protein [Meira miltonrushii]|uniref:Acetyl-CoA synthetase-like protein n=1 Tax=Meira miltonrushii TaxID=1280837 RepID=A0A316VEA1_9BASI|nr:acetyl-CoA synthetase-like protein [Meira miltonrushii]PWN34613.1 acetyl-CoA synthetase-like protein [Meira miltonrushii]
MTITDERPFISINEMLDYRFKENANDDLVTFAIPALEGEKGAMEYETTTFSQFNTYVNWATYTLSKQFPPRKIGKPLRVVGLIARTDLDSYVNLFALFRLGHGALILSPNNSVEGIIHLIKKMSCRDIIYQQDSKETVKQLQEEMNLTTTLWIMINDMKGQTAPEIVRSELTYEEESDDFCTILHSSGSSNLPKPLPMTHKAWCRNMYGVEMGGASVFPFSHFSGVQSFFLSFQTRRTSMMMSSRVPYTSPNLVHLIETSLKAGSPELLCVPLTLKLLSEAPNGSNLLAQYQYVGFAGSVCPKPLGDKLVKAGVNLITFYGAKETGFCMSSLRDFERDKGWDIMRPRGNFADFARWEKQDDDEDVFELVVEKGWPPLSAANRPDGAFATSDLYTKHPTIPNGFHYISRKDDSLVHVHGKKTNPILIEMDLRSSPLIKDAMVFGANKMQTGCLIIPKNDDLTIEGLWDAISLANKRAPTWSRLEKEMVVVLPSSETFVMTDKKSLIRVKTTKKFESLIEEKYSNIEHSSQKHAVDQVKLSTSSQALSVVQTIVSEVMKDQITHLGSIKEDDVLFDKGLDSLAVMKIGSLIRSRIQFPTGVEADETAAFHHPTIRTLAEYLYGLSSGGSMGNGHDESLQSLDTMRQLLNKYTQQIETRSSSTENQGRKGTDTILLTGATGSLGAHLLSIAAQRQNVETVICLCRAKTNEEAQARVNESLTERRLPSVQSLASRCNIICLSSDLAKNHLGLTLEMYKTVLQSVTSIIHAAWPVNFSMGVTAFESSLQGCVSLINVSSRSSLAQPPRLLFCSSIAAAALHHSSKTQDAVMEELSIEPEDAVPNGYGRSKWIAEALHDAATAKIPNLNSKIVRIGQLSGDIVHGIWNEKEAYPLLIKTAQTIGCLPNLSNHQLYWLPVDVAAEMIVEVAMQGEKGTRVVHVASKDITDWSKILLAVRNAYPQVREVPLEKWLEELRTAKDQDPTSNPAIKLLDYYSSSWSSGSEGGIPKFDTSYTNKLLASKPQILKHTGALSQDNLIKMVSAWQQNGFLVHAL